MNIVDDDTTGLSMLHPERAIAILRIVVGLWFVKSMVTKIGVVWLGGVVPVPGASDRWIEVMPKLLGRYAAGNPIAGYRLFLQDVVLPNARVFAHLTALGETAVGIGLTLGCLTVLASLVGLLLVTTYGLATFWQGPSQQGFHLMLFVSLAMFAWVRAGRCWGLDRVLLARARRAGTTRVARLAIGLCVVTGCTLLLPARASAQHGAAAPVLLLADLTFSGRSANAVQADDPAMARAATEQVRAALQRGLGDEVALADSAQVAAALVAAGAPGLACNATVECVRAVGRRLGATWVVTGQVSKVSNLIWYLSGQLVEVESGRLLLDDGFELKGARDEVVPRGAAVLGRRIVGKARLAIRGV